MVRRRALVTAIVVAGCGRISFDANNDATTTTPTDDAIGDADIADADPDAQAIACSGVIPGNCNSSRFAVCNGRCITICDDVTVNNSADTICGFWGGAVMWIRDAADNACALTLYNGTSMWIGYEQALNAVDVDTSWSWENNEPVTYTNWGPTEPQDIDGIEDYEEQCTVMFGDGRWADTGCQTTQFPFLCAR